MERFHYNFPMNYVMVGSMIPGERVDLPPAKVVSYPDGSTNKLIMRRKIEDPMVSYPNMAEPHTHGHGFFEKMRALFEGRHGDLDKLSKQSDIERAARGIKMREGYEPLAENRDWRRA